MKNGCILCGAVGTGKSMTGLAYYFHNYKNYERPPLIIITTAKKRDSKEWDREIERWGLTRHTDIKDILEHNKVPPVYIDSWNNIKKYQKLYGCFFMFDEQRVVGRGSWVKTFLNITRKNQWILLSATPGDTWSDYVPVFIANGYFKNRREFEWKHVEFDPYIKKFPKIRRYINTEMLEKYRKEILVIMKFDMPAISHHMYEDVMYDVIPYATVWKNRWNIYKNKPIENTSELYYTLRKVVNSSKRRLDRVAHICCTHPRVIIFYSFDYELELLRKMCEDNDLTYYEWNGHKHEDLPEEGPWIYLAQYDSACEGWECTSTNIMIFFDLSYSYRKTMQASGRINRLNTPYKDLYFYHMRSPAPIDMVISKALDRKEDFNEEGWLEDLEQESASFSSDAC